MAQGKTITFRPTAQESDVIERAWAAEGINRSKWIRRALVLVAQQEAALRNQVSEPQIFSGVSEISKMSIARPTFDRRPFKSDFKRGKK